MRAAILLTYRSGDTPDRHANLLAVLAWLAKTPDCEVIVTEQDALPTLTGPLPHPNCRIVFAYNPGPFNKAWGLNVAARLSDAPVLVFTDSDLIVPGMLDKMIEHCTERYVLVKPYRRLLDLTAEESIPVRAGRHDPATLSGLGQQGSEDRGEYLVPCGGMFAIRALSFHRLGGWDERFRGWGGEDDAMTHAVQRARLSMLEFDEVPALHLWHPRSPATHAHYQDNCALAARYGQLSDAELLRLSEVSRNVMGNLKKYQPTS